MIGKIWKDGTRRGIAYVEGREAAEKVMQVARRSEGATTVLRNTATAEEALHGAMAVYSDKRGKPFAWQIPFDLERWDQVAAMLLHPATVGSGEMQEGLFA